MGNKLGFGVEVDDGGALRKINAIGKAFDKMGGPGSGASFFGNLGARAVARGFDLIAGSIGSVTGFIDNAIKAAEEDQVSISLLTQALKNNIPAWDGNTAAIDTYTEAQINRGFADEQTRASIGQLVGVTHDLTQAMQLTTLAEDLARAKGLDLATATDIVTKAHQGNGKALKALGIDVAKGATAMEILDAITKNVTGSTDTYNQTLAGKVNVSQVKFNEAVEKIGYQLMPVLADIMQRFSDDWLPALGRGWDKVYHAIRPVLDILGKVIGAIGTAIQAVKNFINLAQKIPAAMPVLPGLPHFDQGGTVPGPLNSPQLIVAHGGEQVLTRGQQHGSGGSSGGFTIQGVSRRDMERIVDEQLFVLIRRAAPGTS